MAGYAVRHRFASAETTPAAKAAGAGELEQRPEGGNQ
jgi:hypothetical protein